MTASRIVQVSGSSRKCRKCAEKHSFPQTVYCWGSLLGKKWAGHSGWPPCVLLLSFPCPPGACCCPAVVLWPLWPTLCPPVLLSSWYLQLSFFGSSSAAAASLSPVVLLPSSSCLSLVLSSSYSLVLLLACSPHVLVWSQLVFLLSSWCVHVAFLPSSFCPLLSSLCPPLVFLLSCCCRAVRCFPRQAHDNNDSRRLSCLGSMLV